MESQSAKIPGSKGLESAESHFHIGIKHSQDGQIELAIAHGKLRSPSSPI
ncbi:MAG: hypothetical protein HC939_20345 [Pleurocapsa sp. SU_5_0]|nr:hypothetical protein [Pleurocapsa sp. SU_5_0]